MKVDELYQAIWKKDDMKKDFVDKFIKDQLKETKESIIDKNREM